MNQNSTNQAQISKNDPGQGSILDIGSIPHPFLSRYSKQVPDCAAKLLRFLNNRPPLDFRIDEDRIIVDFDTGYIRATCTESANKIRYTSFCQESTHDGGGYNDDYFTLTAAQDKPIPESLRNEAMCSGLEMPPSSGYWLDADGCCFLVNPFGLQGVFELWMKNDYLECGWGDEPAIIKEIGHPPRAKA